MSSSHPSPTPALADQAQSAFEAGNHRLTQELARQLARSNDPEDQARASTLRARLSPHSLTKYLFLLTTLLLVVVTIFAYTR